MRIAGVLGPAAFIGAWVVGGARRDDYSPVHDAISRLAAVGTTTRPLMTAGFVAFGIALPMYASSLRRGVAGPAWIAAAATGIATLGVAAAPLEHSSAVDSLHAVFAGLGYITLAATPLLAARPLAAAGHVRLARGGLVAGTVSALSLALTVTGAPTGLFQRVGLTAGDVWVVASAIAMMSGRVAMTARQPRTAPLG